MHPHCFIMYLREQVLHGVCEGHHLALHDLLRSQPMHSGNVDLLKDVIQLIVFMCETQSSVQSLSEDEVKLVTSILKLIVESMQVRIGAGLGVTGVL